MCYTYFNRSEKLSPEILLTLCSTMFVSKYVQVYVELLLSVERHNFQNNLKTFVEFLQTKYLQENAYLHWYIHMVITHAFFKQHSYKQYFFLETLE